jgi:hypothetical protein
MSALEAPPHPFIHALSEPPGRPCAVCGHVYEGALIVGDERIESRRFVEFRVQEGEPVVAPATLIGERHEPGRTVRMHRDPATGAAQAVTVEEHMVLCSDCIVAAVQQLGHSLGSVVEIERDELARELAESERELRRRSGRAPGSGGTGLSGRFGRFELLDEVGRGATAMLEKDPNRHVWGLGRHHVGSNFFWYLKDPAGNFSEYYSDMDCIVDDALWSPQVWEGARGLFNWGPPPPASMLAPEDLAGYMLGAHSATGGGLR